MSTPPSFLQEKRRRRAPPPPAMTSLTRDELTALNELASRDPVLFNQLTGRLGIRLHMRLHALGGGLLTIDEADSIRRAIPELHLQILGNERTRSTQVVLSNEQFPKLLAGQRPTTSAGPGAVARSAGDLPFDAEREALAAITSITQVRSRAFRPLTMHEMLEDQPQGFMLDGLLRPGEMSIVWGSPKAGKSGFALHIAYGLAAGRPTIFGRAATQQRVLYLAAEGSQGFRNRLRALPPVDTFWTWPRSIDLQRLSAPTTDVIAFCRENAITLVVVDTASRALAGGDENSPTDMGAFVRNVDRIREETGAHVMIIHHDGVQQRRPRGHQSLQAAADVLIHVSRGKGGLRIAKVTEARDLPEGTTLCFRFREVVVGTDVEGKPVATFVVDEVADADTRSDEPTPRSRRGGPSDEKRGEVLALRKQRLSRRQIERRTGIPKSTVDMIIRQAFPTTDEPATEASTEAC